MNGIYYLFIICIKCIIFTQNLFFLSTTPRKLFRTLFKLRSICQTQWNAMSSTWDFSLSWGSWDVCVVACLILWLWVPCGQRNVSSSWRKVWCTQPASLDWLAGSMAPSLSTEPNRPALSGLVKTQWTLCSRKKSASSFSIPWKKLLE